MAARALLFVSAAVKGCDRRQTGCWSGTCRHAQASSTVVLALQAALPISGMLVMTQPKNSELDVSLAPGWLCTCGMRGLELKHMWDYLQ